MVLRRGTRTGWLREASTPFAFWRRLSMRRRHWQPWVSTRMLAKQRHNYTLYISRRLPLSDVRPVAFFLSFVKIGIIIDDVLFQEVLPQIAGLLLKRSVAPPEFEIVVFVKISANLRWHMLNSVMNIKSININMGKKINFYEKTKELQAKSRLKESSIYAQFLKINLGEVSKKYTKP